MNARILLSVLLLIVLISACSTASITVTQPAPTSIPTDSPVTLPTDVLPTAVPTKIPSTPRPSLVPMSDFMNIIGLWRWNPWKEPEVSIVLGYAREMGANWVGFGETPCKSFREQGGIRIDCSDLSWTAADSEGRYMIQQAHENGLRVEFFAPMFGDQNGDPDNAEYGSSYSLAEWNSFLTGYRQQLLHYAQLAEEEKADLFVIGQEYRNIARRNDWWPGMISEIRSIYHGPITYGAKPEDLEAITYWDKLDFIGCDCGQGFDDNFTADQIAAYWGKTYTPVLERLTAKYGKKAILTEMSYFAIHNAYYTGIENARLDTEYQAALWEGMFQAFSGKSWLVGWYAGPIMSNPQQGGPWDIDYEVIGKPAADVIAKQFGGTAPTFITAPSSPIEASSVWMYHDGSGYAQPIPWFGSVRKLDFAQDSQFGKVIEVHGTGLDGVGFWSRVHPQMDIMEFRVRITSKNQPYILVAGEKWDDVNGQAPVVSIRNYADDPTSFYDGKWHLVRIPISSFIYQPYGFANPCIFFAYPGDEPATMQIADVRLVTVQK